MAYYYEFKVICPKILEEGISDILFENGAAGTEVKGWCEIDGKYDWADTGKAVASTNDNYEIKGYFDKLDKNTQISIKKACNQLLEFLGLNNELVFSIEKRKEEPWDKEWKKFYKPISEGIFTIVPEWENFNGNQTEIRINPNTAFGTGQHETTRLCLNYLSELDLQGKKILDVGTGSGILAIAALKKGGDSALLLDTDENAVKSASNNLNLNNIENARIELRSIEKEDKADIVIANITANILLSIKNLLCNAVNEKGNLLLSGIIDERAEEIKRAFSENIKFVSNKKYGEWNAFLFQKQ